MANASEARLEHDYDGYWKDLLDRFLPECLTLLAPDLNEFIDFGEPVTSLDTELHELFPHDRSGRRFVDKLLRVRLRSGEVAGLLLHVDVQIDHDPEFPRRMFRYHYRLFDKYDLPIYSLALLGDLDPEWRPKRFARRTHDNLVLFRYRVVKLIAFLERMGDLERSANLVALLVLAFLRTRTSRPDRRRLQWKIDLFALALERGFPLTTFQSICRLVDWLMRIPADLTQEFRAAMKDLAEQKRTPILMDIEIEAMAIGEQRGEARGEAKGEIRAKREDIVRILATRFGACPDRVVESLERCFDLAVLDRLVIAAVTAPDLEGFATHCAADVPPI